MSFDNKVRVFGYSVARELTFEELGMVSGGIGDVEDNPEDSEFGDKKTKEHRDTYCKLDPDAWQAQQDDCTGC